MEKQSNAASMGTQTPSGASTLTTTFSTIDQVALEKCTLLQHAILSTDDKVQFKFTDINFNDN